MKAGGGGGIHRGAVSHTLCLMSAGSQVRSSGSEVRSSGSHRTLVLLLSVCERIYNSKSAVDGGGVSDDEGGVSNDDDEGDGVSDDEDGVTGYDTDVSDDEDDG